MDPRERIADQLLVLRCQEGDIAAFEQLVNRWQERLWRHAWRLTGDESAAWDALQEAWIGMSRGLQPACRSGSLSRLGLSDREQQVPRLAAPPTTTTAD